ncbi:MAG: hypothetical protein Q4F05_00415 [bacterium]|nr:hypothetical protein [bacterium]
MTPVKECKGSITVEAAFIMPFFIFVLLSFLYFFQLFTLQEHIQESITRVSKEASQYGYVYNYIEEKKGGEQEEKETTSAKKVVQGFVDGTLFRTKFLENMGSNVNDSCIMGGIQGISFVESSFMKQENNIEVVAIYEVKIPVLFLNLHPFTVVQRVHSRAFVGERLVDNDTGDEDGKLEQEEDSYVYITRTGTVFHKDKNCTYLNIKLIKVAGNEILTKRNFSGAKYYPCESCMKEKLDNGKSYYITEYGTRYHSCSTCNKIDRDITKIKLSQVGSRRPCSKCGK